jgi:hypothetical protein
MPDRPSEQQVEAARLREAWRGSPGHTKAIKFFIFEFGSGIILAVFLLTGYAIISKFNYGEVSTASTAIYVGAAGASIGIGIVFALLDFRRRLREFYDGNLIERYAAISDEQGKLLDEDQLRLGALWRLSEERLKIYHEIATKQASTSFRNAQLAIATGFVVIIVGAAAVFFSKNVTIAVVVGALGTAGAALSAYIGKTFLRLQENAASHLRSYFDQPREQFRYLAAERLMNRIPDGDSKNEAINELIKLIGSDNSAS